MFTKRFNDSRIVWTAAIVVTGIFSIGDFLNALPKVLSESKYISPIINIYKKMPLFDIGMSWLIPVLITIVVSLVIHFSKRKTANKS